MEVIIIGAGIYLLTLLFYFGRIAKSLSAIEKRLDDRERFTKAVNVFQSCIDSYDERLSLLESKEQKKRQPRKKQESVENVKEETESFFDTIVKEAQN